MDTAIGVVLLVVLVIGLLLLLGGFGGLLYGFYLRYKENEARNAASAGERPGANPQ